MVDVRADEWVGEWVDGWMVVDGRWMDGCAGG
jgi:hypothetical protein